MSEKAARVLTWAIPVLCVIISVAGIGFGYKRYAYYEHRIAETQRDLAKYR